MQLEQSFVVDASQATVWAAFHDPALLVSCLPGASLRGEVEGDKVPLTFKIKLGPIAAAFAGEGQLALDENAKAGNFTGQAIDARSNSRVKGEASFSTTPEGSGTKVGVAVSFTITGSLAQFSREGIVRALADQLTQQFAANLQARLAEMPSAETTAPVAAAADTVGANAETAPAPAAAAPPQPAATPATAARPAASAPAEAPALSVFSLIGAILRDYWRRLFKKGRAS